MKIKNLAENAKDFTGNVWKIESKNEVALIDVSTGDSWRQISDLEDIDKVIITHSHYDHIDNISKVADKFSPVIYAYDPENIPVDTEKISERDKIDIFGSVFQVYHTPGHKDDSICLFNKDSGILFTGDLLFPNGSFGRTDLEEGNRDLLIKSIRKIIDLDVKEMYCGHEPAALENVNQQVKDSLENAEKRESKY